MTTKLRVTTLGGLSLELGGQAIEGLVSRKVEALIVYLACEPRAHSREHLATLLWGEASQERALASLRMALSSLQQQLSPFITVTRKSISINTNSAYWLDAEQLRTALNAAETQWAREGRLSRLCAESLEEAINLFRGDFLAGFYVRESPQFDEWMLGEKETLRIRTIQAMQHLVDHAQARREYAKGLALARRVLELDPLDEEGQRQMIRLLALSNQRTAAIAQYGAYSQTLEAELDTQPEDETTSLYEEIEAGRWPPRDLLEPVTVHNLPAQPTSFVGRREEQKQIGLHLDQADTRLITLVGPGGVGKTRLAIAVALDWASDFRDGVFYVPLASVQSPDLLLSSILDALEITPGDPDENKLTLKKHLTNKHLLLVLDNLEHLLDEVGLLEDIAAASPHIKILVTSREQLNLPGEWIIPLEGLCFPQGEASTPLAEYEAVQLFMQRARYVRADFSAEGMLDGVARICQLVEGLPLAIEMAAAWLRTITPDQIAAQIEQDLRILTNTVRNVEQRHRSLQAVFEHSWKLLPADEQKVLMRLSVFQGGFTLESAQQVTGSTLPMLASLVGKSLLRGEVNGRFDLHQLVLRFAAEKLSDSGTLPETQSAYVQFFIDFVEQVPPHLVGANQVQWLDGLHAELDNFRQCWQWLAQHDNYQSFLGIGNGLVDFWLVRGYATEGRRWLEEGLAHIDAVSLPRLYAQTLYVLGRLTQQHDDLPQSRRYLEESLSIWQRLEDQTGITNTLTRLGNVEWREGDYARAEAVYSEALDLASEMNDQAVVARLLESLSSIQVRRGNYSEARRLQLEAVAINEELGHDINLAGGYYNYAMLQYRQSDFLEAKQFLERSMKLAHELGLTYILCLGHQLLGRLIMFLDEDPDQARLHCQKALQICAEIKDDYVAGITHGTMGFIESTQKNWEVAQKYYKEGLLLSQRASLPHAIMGLNNLGCVAARLKEYEIAIKLLAANEAIMKSLGIVLDPPELPEREACIAILKKSISDEEFTKLWGEGSQMDLESSISLAISL